MWLCRGDTNIYDVVYEIFNIYEVVKKGGFGGDLLWIWCRVSNKVLVSDLLQIRFYFNNTVIMKDYRQFCHFCLFYQFCLCLKTNLSISLKIN